MTDRPAIKAKDAPDLAGFDWQDPFRLDDQLTEEERLVRDTAHAYAQEKLQPRVIEAFREDEREHRDAALANGAERAPAYPLLAGAIKLGCRIAIKVSERV